MREQVDHRQLLEDPNRVMQWKANDSRNQLEPRGLARETCQKHGSGGSNGEPMPVMLREMKPVEAGVLDALEKCDAVLIDLLAQFISVELDVIENPELDGHQTTPFLCNADSLPLVLLTTPDLRAHNSACRPPRYGRAPSASITTRLISCDPVPGYPRWAGRERAGGRPRGQAASLTRFRNTLRSSFPTVVSGSESTM